MMKKIYVVLSLFFILFSFSSSYAGQEIGNGTLKSILKLERFNRIIEDLQGHYWLESEGVTMDFSLSMESMENEIQMDESAPSSTMVNFIVHSKIEPQILGLRLVMVEEGKQLHMKFIDAYDLMTLKKLNAQLYKKNIKTKNYEWVSKLYRSDLEY